MNHRRELFLATPEQVRVVLAESVGSLLENTYEPVPSEYDRSAGAWPSDGHSRYAVDNT